MSFKPSDAGRSGRPSLSQEAPSVRLAVRLTEEDASALAQFVLRHPGTTLSQWLRYAVQTFLAAEVVPALEKRPTVEVLALARARALMDRTPPPPLMEESERLALKFRTWHAADQQQAEAWRAELVSELRSTGRAYDTRLADVLENLWPIKRELSFD